MLPLRMERVPDGGRLIAAPTEGWLPTGGWGHPPLRGCRDGPVLLPGAGPRPARQDSHRERWLKKPRRSYGTAPAAIFANPGPSGPEGIAESHSDFARRKFCFSLQVRVPRNGVRGAATWSTGAVRLGANPGGVLVTLPPRAK